MKVWMRRRSAGRTASAARRMSAGAERARPQITGPFTRIAIACTASKSPGEAIGKPASSTSTPSSAKHSAIRSFSSMFIEKPGDCSPSRKVVSKMMMRSGSSEPKLGWSMRVVAAAMAAVSLGAVVRLSASGHPLSGAGVPTPGATPRGG